MSCHQNTIQNNKIIITNKSFEYVAKFKFSNKKMQ